MTSTTWTATRADLVQALAQARTERELVVTRLQSELAREAQRKAGNRRRKAEQRERDRDLTQAQTTARVAMAPHDPDAAQHRADLLAELRRTP